MTRTLVRRTMLSGAALLALAAVAACGSSDDSGSPGTGGNASVAASRSTNAAGTFNAADVMFAQMMIPHHQQAIEMSVLAETRAADPEVKTLARQIKAAQDPEITTMTGWLTAWGHPMSASSMGGMDMGQGQMPGMMSQADMAKLKAANGKDFDRQFVTMMIAHHQGAITMAKDELARGANTDVKALAQHIISSQQTEIDTMNKILARL